MKKGILVIILIAIIAVVGILMSSSDKEQSDEQADANTEESSSEDNSELLAQEGAQVVIDGSSSYKVMKGWLDKPTEEVVGTTNAVDGYIVYSAEEGLLKEVSIEIDDQTFKTSKEDRDEDVAKMFGDAGNITIALKEAIELAKGEFSTTIPLLVTVNGVSQTIDFTVSGSAGADQSTASGSAKMTFSQFGMEAPSFVGVYNVADEMTVEFTVTTSS